MTEEPAKSETAKKEEEILEFWEREKIFEKSLAKPAPKGEFVFYDGPPFATGTPHSGSLLSSVSKDLIPRYKTMRGYRVRRRWGWDCHGLPIENLVEKKLGLKNKKEIFSVGVEKFNETARSMVLEYVHDWKRYVERVGRFVDFENSYKTMDATYTESVWWALKQIHNKGNLYEGRKVLLYCPHCETPLAKAEIAMDNTYQDITEEAVTVKFKVKEPKKYKLPEHTYLLAWTTTPWTLPGNVALAVGSNIEYAVLKNDDEFLITAKDRVPTDTSHIEKTMRGKELLEVEYEPLYEIEKVKAHKGKKWVVLPADFVSTEEGTGIVHTAVIYGEDDYTLGLKEGLPMVPLLNPNATYNDEAPEFLRGKYIKKAETDIKADLASRGLLFTKEMHTHSYPHCYRCGTPLIYNAVSSWFINTQSVKAKLLSENEKIQWFPEHLKHGRFKNILENAPDWTISRNRFWASPLPIWKDAKGNVTVIGSLEELKARTKKSGNRYFIMRHGEAENNVETTHHQETHKNAKLTETGKEQVAKSAAAFGRKVDVIIASPLLRARESAEILAHTIGFPVKQIIYDNRLMEWEVSREYEGKPRSTMVQYYDYDYIRSPHRKFSDGENFAELVVRAGEFIYEIEKKYSEKEIFLVTHSGLARALLFIAGGFTFDDLKNPFQLPRTAAIEEFPFIPLPHNKNYELDYHLPYIDQIQLKDEKGNALTRVPEVVDCWVESGAMPFAEYHYPFENRAEFEKRSPGDFVSEYIGQTRAWFYYMHALGVHLFGQLAFRNVVTTGTVLAANGEKLSKSKQNYTDPALLFDRFGADAFRYYLMSSVVMQAEDLTFKDEGVKEVYNRVVNILRNTYAFYLLYKDEAREGARAESPHVLDRWILARLDETLKAATEAFDRYDVIRATRPMRDFIDDFSTWYVRRSRERVKGTDEEDKQHALATMRRVLHAFSRIIAPVMPFVAEEIFQSVKTHTDPESVHLSEWPTASASGGAWFAELFGKSSGRDSLIADMAEVRRIVSLGLEARQNAGIKVRQPLSTLTVSSTRLAGKEELLHLIADEVNIKEVRINDTQTEPVVLDTEVNAALREEGDVRELVRFVQDLRKRAGLLPKDTAVLVISSDPEATMFIEKQWAAISAAAKLSSFEEGAAREALELSGMKLFLDVRKS